MGGTFLLVQYIQVKFFPLLSLELYSVFMVQF